jgi:hypothetical protein
MTLPVSVETAGRAPSRATPHLYAFEVEHALVLEGGRPIVFARQLGDEPFTLTDQATLGGYPLECFLDMPRRLLHPDGTPRLDVVAFQLRALEDLPRFQRGASVWLAVRPTAGANAAPSGALPSAPCAPVPLGGGTDARRPSARAR